MARKTKIVVIDGERTEDNRDGQKAFLITEMDSFHGDKWAKRALLALSNVKFDFGVLGDIENLGWQGVAALGMQFLSALRFEDADPLLDELMSCVRIIPDPAKFTVHRPIGLGGAEDIEEIKTISILQAEVFNLHANFSKIASVLKSRLLAGALGANSSNTATSAPQSAPSSRRAARP